MSNRWFLLLICALTLSKETSSQSTAIFSKVNVSGATITSGNIDLGTFENCFDGDTTTIARSNINPFWLQIEFPEKTSVNNIRVLLGEVGFLYDQNDWWAEAADLASDITGKTGSYKLVVATRHGVTGNWDSYTFPSTESKKIWKIWIRRTVGDNFVHIPEIELWATAGIITGLPATLQQYEGWKWRNLPNSYLMDNNLVIGKKQLGWTTSNAAVAYVDEEGNINSVGQGIANISASYKSLVSPVMTVTVKAALRPVKHDTSFLSNSGPAANAVYQVPILILNFVPTIDNTNVDRSYSPNLELGRTETVTDFENLVTAYIKRIKFAIEQGSRFRNYKNPDSRPSINYKILDFITIYEPIAPSVPLSGYSGGTLMYAPDYEQIFNRFDVKDYVENKGVREIWFWATGVDKTFPGYDPAITPPENFRGCPESNMSSPITGDISNSYRVPDDLPVYNKSYVVIHNTHHRDQSINMEPHTHQMEAMFTYVNEKQDGNSDLFWDKFVGQIGRCGWTHTPPNTKINYGYMSYIQHNPSLVQPVLCDNEDWKPDNSGTKSMVSYHNWEDKAYSWPDGVSSFDMRNELQWFIYWMQCIPGLNNNIPYGSHNTMSNWWEIIADWDSCNIYNCGLYKSNDGTYIENDFGNLLKVYPNPTDGNIYIEMDQYYSDVMVKIISDSGRVISSSRYGTCNKLKVEFTGNKGLNILEINTKEGKKARIKIIKN